MALPLTEKVTSSTAPIRRVAREAVAATAPHFQEAAASWAAWARRSRRDRAGGQVERYQDELRAAAGTNRRREIARLSNLASAYRRRDELAEAQVCATRAVEVARDAGDERLIGLTLNGLGLVQARHPVAEPALASFTEAREIFRRAGDRQIEGQVLANLGAVYAGLGDRQAARAVWSEALSLLALDSSAHEKLEAWLADHPDADPAEDETAEGQPSVE
jgi:tetratricopeptide (TPR) repeat protein